MTSTAMNPATALQGAYDQSAGMLLRNLDGISSTDAQRRPRSDMNNIVWLVGHIAYWRHEMANAAGVPGREELPELSVFRGVERGDPADTAAWTFEQVVELCAVGLTRMKTAFASAAEGDPSTGAFMGMVGPLLIHEAYTVGQVAVVRRFAGYSGAL